MGLLDGINSFVEKYLYWTVPTSIGITDILEIIIIACLFYGFMAWIKKTRAWTLLKGIIIIVAFVILAAIFQMNTILWLVSKLLNVSIIAIIVVFQPELRNALEHLGRTKIFSSLFAFNTEESRIRKEKVRVVTEVVDASVAMGSVKTGALMVFEKDSLLEDIIQTGIEIDAEISKQLIINIFEHNTPLHDGAVVIRNQRIAAATCYLPLSDNMQISKDLGTRHRAALGISETSDSLTVVVSEETGKISVAHKGKLNTGLGAEELAKILREFLLVEEEENSKRAKIKRRLKHDQDTNE